MSSFNKIILVGYLGSDPTLKYTPSGDPVCTISVATTEKRKEESSTTWFRVTFWRKQAELVGAHFKKGAQIYVEGKLREEKYTDREGQTRASLEVTATEFQFIGGKEGREERADAPVAEKREAVNRALGGKPPASTAATRMSQNDDDEVPF